MAPKRAFGGVLRPFGGGFRGPNRERASVFSGAGRGRAGGSAVEPGRDQRVQRRGIGAGRGVQRCRRDGPAAGSQKKCSEGKMRRRPNTYGHKKNGPRSVHFYFCYSTGFCSGMLVRYTLPHDNGSALREPVSFAGDFRQHVLLQQPVCLRFRSARRSGVTAVKASAIRSLSRSAARRPGSRPSAARNLPSLLLAPSAAGVTAPPRQYGRPPATGESPASSLRRASPARDSTAYRPAP